MWFLSVEKVVNEAKPKAPQSFELVRDLTLGGEDAPEEQIFTFAVNMAAADDGHMFVVDPGNFNVSVFNAKGELVRTFGKAGEGPGEFQEPVSITMDNEQRPVVFDTGSKKMMVFEADGTLVRETRFAPNIQGIARAAFLPDGSIGMVAFKNDENFQFSWDLSTYDAAMKPVKSWYTRPTPALDWSKSGDPSFWVKLLKDNFEAIAAGSPILATAGDRLVMATTDRYEGRIVDAKGKERVFTKAFKPKVMSEEAKYVLCEMTWQYFAANPAISANLTQAVFERALGQTEFPARLMPIYDVVPLNGGFAMLANYDPARKTGKWELFDKGGVYQGDAAFEGGGQFFTANKTHLFVIGSNEEGDLEIARYLLKRK